MTTKENQADKDLKPKSSSQSLCGMLIGFICGFIGAGGGMMMLSSSPAYFGYELKTAVGTSVFIMTFTAFTGALSHFTIGGMPDIPALILCILFTLLGARLAALVCQQGLRQNAEPGHRRSTDRPGSRYGSDELPKISRSCNAKVL